MSHFRAKWQAMCREGLTTALRRGKTMISDDGEVRVTGASSGPSKKHLLVTAAAEVGLILIDIALWVGPSRSSTLYPVNINGKYGYINMSAKVIISPQFDRAETFTEGLAPVAVG